LSNLLINKEAIMSESESRICNLLRDLKMRSGYESVPDWFKSNVDEAMFLFEIGKTPNTEFLKRIAQYLEFEAGQDLRNSMLLELLRDYIRTLRHFR